MKAREAILSLLNERAAGKSICPSEAARRLAGDEEWRSSLHDIRVEGRALAAEGLIEITKKGKVVDPELVKGVIRYRLNANAAPQSGGGLTSRANPSDSLLEKVEEHMREAAERLILPRWQSLSDGEVEEKDGPGDLVTIADREAEEFLTPILESLVPGSVVVGEEAVSAGMISTDVLTTGQDCWLVDPVDGTWNFVQGSDRFGVMVALVRAGQVTQSWILFPVDGRCAVAEKGAGATFGGERLANLAAKPFAEAHGDYASIYVEEPFKSAFSRAVENSAGTRSGRCSAYAYGDLARGLIDFVVQYKMTPWDHAPGQLLVEEAGGRFGFLPSGSPYTPMMHPDQPMLTTARSEDWPGYAEELMGGVDSFRNRS